MSSGFAEATILNKYTISYFKCERCGFVQTEDPYWLQEAYASPINRSDVGLVSRNSILAKKTKAIISAFFDREKKFIDFGGGYGLLVRMMRDVGFDFYRYDSHCENIFARDFEADLGNADHYELLTAFEVFEHLRNPLQEIDQMLSLSQNILFTTDLVPREVPKPDAWWYYGLEHGQHISLYSADSLRDIASKRDLNFYSNGRTLHLLTKKRISPLFFTMLTSRYCANFFNVFVRRDSLLMKDYQKSTSKQQL